MSLVPCKTCGGRKKIAGMGMIDRECDECKGIGWFDVECDAEKKPKSEVIVTIKKRGRPARLVK